MNGREHSRFEAAWLALREPADAAARSDRLTARAGSWLASRTAPHTLLDLGSGTGSNVRFLAPRLPGPQHWRLVDHDGELLAGARKRLHGLLDEDGGHPEIAAACHDLAAIDSDLVEGADLVAASALLDLVSRRWLEILAETCAAGGQALLMTLTVDGDWGFVDRTDRRVETTTDARVRQRFRAHQGRDKGLGAALGPDASEQLARRLEDAGFDVEREASPWRLEAGNAAHHPLAGKLLANWRDAAIEHAGGDDASIRRWHDRRLDAVLAGDLGVFVGHEDLFAAPQGATA